MRAFRIVQPIFSISYCFRDIRGPKGQKCDFGAYIKFSFFIQFWWDFFHWISLKESFQNCCRRLFYLLPFLRYKGPKGSKMRFWDLHKIFIFHPILMGFFFIGFLSKRAFRIVTADFVLHFCVKYITVSNTLLWQASTRSIFISTLLLLTCCGRIMLSLRSPSVYRAIARSKIRI